MNTYKCIILGLIGISTAGLNGMQSMRTSYLPRIVQHLNEYRYDIGGTVAACALLYGGYRLYHAWKNTPYKTPIRITCNDTYLWKRKQIYVTIEDIYRDSQPLTLDSIRATDWTTGDGRYAIINFVNKVVSSNYGEIRILYNDHLSIIASTKFKDLPSYLATEFTANPTPENNTYVE